MPSYKVERIKAENTALKKALDAMQEDINALRDLVFAFAKMHGRIIIPKEIVDTLRTDDGVHIERLDDGTVKIEFVSNVKEVKAGEIVGVDGKALS